MNGELPADPGAPTYSGDHLVKSVADGLPCLPIHHHYHVTGVSWGAYEYMVERTDWHKLRGRLTYDRGALEYAYNGFAQERWRWLLTSMIWRFAEHAQIPIEPVGSVWIARPDLRRGLRPHECFFVQNARRFDWDKPLDFAVEALPDFVVDVQYTDAVIDRVGVFAALGVPELWTYDGRRLRVQLLRRGAYHDTTDSRALPTMPLALVADVLSRSRQKIGSTLLWEFRDRLAAL